MSSEIIQIVELVKDYDANTRALNHINLTINASEWVSVMGPSGSGKTTLLNIIGCLDSPTEGTVIIDGVDITKLTEKDLTKVRSAKLGFVFQEYHLIPYLNILENVMIAQYYNNKVDENSAKEVLEIMGLGDRLTHLPSQLSGGEQQRVCIARALINKPKIILADEPTGNLDQKNGEIIMNLLRVLHNEGHTILLITHNPDIGKLGDKVVRLVDGKIVSDEIIKVKR